MIQSTFGVVIMAAGKGTRLKSRRPKVLHEIGGKALLLHVIAAARTVAPPEQIFCVIGHEADRVRSAVESTGVQFVLQAEQRGTGHALQQVKAHFAQTGQTPPEHLLVLSGRCPPDSAGNAQCDAGTPPERACRDDDSDRRSARSDRLWPGAAGFRWRCRSAGDC